MNGRRLLAFAAAASLAAPALAHHSFAMFDLNKTITLQGTVDNFKWTNPHAWIEMTVADGPQAGKWNIEMTSPNNLVTQGWKRTTLKPGDKVTMQVHPLRDGKKGGSFAAVTLPDGSTLKGQ